MINTLQELLEDYARFSCMEDKIDPETSEELQKGVKDYLKQLNELNLLTIPVVVDCKHDNEIMRQGDGFVYSTCGDCGDEL
tara:strand:- start:2287 stop:2529 length:243 start_codon:yes stop_codon:yes gene_type:complete